MYVSIYIVYIYTYCIYIHIFSLYTFSVYYKYYYANTCIHEVSPAWWPVWHMTSMDGNVAQLFPGWSSCPIQGTITKGSRTAADLHLLSAAVGAAERGDPKSQGPTRPWIQIGRQVKTAFESSRSELIPVSFLAKDQMQSDMFARERGVNCALRGVNCATGCLSWSKAPLE